MIPVTQPTELILFEGEPTWALIDGDILYADNTGSDILLDVPTQQNYLLLSGRWYRSKGLEGPWEFVPPDQLPAGFKSIPEDSPKGNVLTHVAGTPQAEEALADAQIPQVAAVKRGPAKLEVRYDGEPKFEKIPDTSLEYAKNSPIPVIKAGDKYYACDAAVWYVASAPGGPWQVADSIPDEIMKIPPEIPIYNVKYVQVYDSTPEVVYVGYTPSYLGCYPYYGTVVWGTGYWYTPWIGSIYYPAPWSYGFHAGYSPYYGWSFGVSLRVRVWMGRDQHRLVELGMGRLLPALLGARRLLPHLPSAVLPRRPSPVLRPSGLRWRRIPASGRGSQQAGDATGRQTGDAPVAARSRWQALATSVATGRRGAPVSAPLSGRRGRIAAPGGRSRWTPAESLPAPREQRQGCIDAGSSARLDPADDIGRRRARQQRLHQFRRGRLPPQRKRIVGSARRQLLEAVGFELEPPARLLIAPAGRDALERLWRVPRRGRHVARRRRWRAATLGHRVREAPAHP